MKINCTFPFLLFFLSIFLGNDYLLGQTSYWMQRAGGSTPDEGYDISIDANGNTYTTGYFTSSATFGTTTLNSSGTEDIFVTKIDSLGHYKWAIKGGGTGSDRGLSIKTDAIGNSYITGYYYGTAAFSSQTITSAGLQDLFIAKYDNAGILQWVKSAGGSNADIGFGINVDNLGNVVVTGEFKGTANFGSFSLTSMNNSIDVFTTKLDANGNFLWAKKGSAIFTDRGLDLACDATGNIYVTGQFTDTITFDQAHNNSLYNAVFLIKYNSNGQEQWFRKIGGGTMNIANGIVIDAGSNIYLTGDFTGNLIFFGTPNTTLTNAYSNKIFISKYDSGGNLQWAKADGSSNDLSSKNITLDAFGNTYIVGNFKCRLNQYADQYGQGTFNSVGFWDIFVTKYNTAGIWQWSRQCGSKQDDYGAGIAVNNSGVIHITGSFAENLKFPVPANFIGYNTYSISNSGTYCNDNNYYNYNYIPTAGNSDILIAKIFDPARAPYDYYNRSGTVCSRPYEGVYCPDSVSLCGPGYIYENSNTTGAGPDFTYHWSTGGTGNSIYINTNGIYSVTQTSADGCFVSSDTSFVTIHPIPAIPTISDNHNFNTNAVNTVQIILCNDSALLTGGNFGANSYTWSGPNGTSNAATRWATISGTYSFNVTNSFGCTNSNSVLVTIDNLLPPIIPKMICLEDSDNNDSISICRGGHFTMYVYDSISNPSADGSCIPNASYVLSAIPSASIAIYNSNCQPYFIPSQSGIYQIRIQITRQNNCGIDTIMINKFIYVELLPLPFDTAWITGNTVICPGDSTVLIAHGTNPIWQLSGSTNDSLWVSQQGSYQLISTITNSFGCSKTVYASVYITSLPQPIITMNPANGLICPNDSVQLFCNGSGTFLWQGPTGMIAGSASTVFVNIPGNYYCIRTDSTGCTLLSNTLLIKQYATPYIYATPSTLLCAGGSVTISVVTNIGSSIQWQAPFNGSSAVQQIITSPGIYTCTVTSCGIQTLVNITITASNTISQIIASGPLTFCSGDSVVLNANSGMVNYIWQPGGFTQPSVVLYQSGTYTLTTTDTNGCSKNSSPVIVNVTPNNTSPPSIKDTTICPGDFATLISSEAGKTFWFNLPNSDTPFDSGSVFITPNLSTTTTYYVLSQKLNCRSSKASVTVTIENCEGITVPNVFSPNGDGINDLFFFSIKDAECFDCKIYDRWGTLIFEWGDADAGWNGAENHTDKKASDGVYYFILSYCDFNNIQKKQTGFIQLLRNLK